MSTFTCTGGRARRWYARACRWCLVYIPNGIRIRRGRWGHMYCWQGGDIHPNACLCVCVRLCMCLVHESRVHACVCFVEKSSVCCMCVEYVIEPGRYVNLFH